MQEIVARSTRNVFAIILVYTFIVFFSEGAVILPYPIYELLFFVLTVTLLYHAIKQKEDNKFFIILQLFSSVYVLTSVFFLQLILPHQYLDPLIPLLSLSDFILIFFYILLFGFLFKGKFLKYKQLHFLFALLILSKLFMFYI